ncbi:MAG: proprotein convertase P-domain-containing protein, partial [Thiohalomonadales bacterium]
DADGTWSPWFGYGRVDAEAAVAEALSRTQSTGNLTFRGDSSPDKSIPDNNTKGIKDKIVSQDDFVISNIKVSVDITHTYIADLLITLISPSGTSVVLHDRAGGSVDDIQAEYNVQSVAGLVAFSGEPVNGEWVLHAQDLAPADRGRLKNWSLDIDGKVDSSVRVEENPGIIIPDNDPVGIERVLTVSGAGQLDSIVVALDITHTYISDLIVELVSPANTSVILHNRIGGSSNNIIKTYSMMNTSNLQNLRGDSVNGDWKLKVSDLEGIDRGKLNKWALKLSPM